MRDPIYCGADVGGVSSIPLLSRSMTERSAAGISPGLTGAELSVVASSAPSAMNGADGGAFRRMTNTTTTASATTNPASRAVSFTVVSIVDPQVSGVDRFID